MHNEIANLPPLPFLASSVCLCHYQGTVTMTGTGAGTEAQGGVHTSRSDGGLCPPQRICPLVSCY